MATDNLPLLVRLEPQYIDSSSIKYNVVAQVDMTGVELLRIPLLFMESLELADGSGYTFINGYGSITKLESSGWQSASFNPKVSGIIANGDNHFIDGFANPSQNLLLLVQPGGISFDSGETVATIWVSRPTLMGVDDNGKARNVVVDANARDVNVSYVINGAIQFAGEVSATAAQTKSSELTGVVGSSDFPAYVIPGGSDEHSTDTKYQSSPSSEIPSAWISVVVEDAIGSTASSPKLLKIVGTTGTTAGNVEILNISGTAHGVTLGKDVSNGQSDFIYKRTVLDEDIGSYYIPGEDVYALYIDMHDNKVNQRDTFESGDILALSRLAIGLTNYADGTQLKVFSPEQVLAADYNLNGQIDGGDLLGLLKQMGADGLTSLRWTVFDKDDVEPSRYLEEYGRQGDQNLEDLATNGTPEFFSTSEMTIDLQQVVLQTSEDLIVKGLSNQAPAVVSVLLRGNVVGPISFFDATLTSSNVSQNQTFLFNAQSLVNLPTFKVGDQIVFTPRTGDSEDYLFDDITSVVLKISPNGKDYSWDQGLYNVHLADAFESSPTTLVNTLEVYRIVYPDFGTVLFLNKGDNQPGTLLDRKDAIIELPGYFIDDHHDLSIFKVDNDGAGGSSEVKVVLLGIDPTLLPPPPGI